MPITPKTKITNKSTYNFRNQNTFQKYINKNITFWKISFFSLEKKQSLEKTALWDIADQMMAFVHHLNTKLLGMKSYWICSIKLRVYSDRENTLFLIESA